MPAFDSLAESNVLERFQVVRRLLHLLGRRKRPLIVDGHRGRSLVLRANCQRSSWAGSHTAKSLCIVSRSLLAWSRTTNGRISAICKAGAGKAQDTGYGTPLPCTWSRIAERTSTPLSSDNIRATLVAIKPAVSTFFTVSRAALSNSPLRPRMPASDATLRTIVAASIIAKDDHELLAEGHFRLIFICFEQTCRHSSLFVKGSEDVSEPDRARSRFCPGVSAITASDRRCRSR